MVPAVSLRTLAWERRGSRARGARGAAGSVPALAGEAQELSAASLDRFNLCPFAHQRSGERVVAADGWSY